MVCARIWHKSGTNALQSVATKMANKDKVLMANNLKITPGRTRTCDLRIRNPLLYPTELQAQQTLALWEKSIGSPRAWVLRLVRTAKQAILNVSSMQPDTNQADSLGCLCPTETKTAKENEPLKARSSFPTEPKVWQYSDFGVYLSTVNSRDKHRSNLGLLLSEKSVFLLYNPVT